MKNIYLLWVFLIVSCSSSKQIVAPNAESKALDALLATKQFRIESDWALPQGTQSMNAIANSGLLGVGNNAASINLIGNSNFLEFKNDSIAADLPYFGERQMGGGYGSENGVKFNGVPEKYSLVKNDKNQRYQMKFSIDGDTTEFFNVIINFFPNMAVIININSSQRTGINYQGTVKAIPIEKQKSL